MSTAPAPGQRQRVGPPRVDGATLATGGLVVVVAGLAWVGVTHPTSWMAAGSTAGVLAGAAPYLLGWGVMMAAMMLPSAAPTITLYAGMRRNAASAGNRGVGPARLSHLLRTGSEKRGLEDHPEDAQRRSNSAATPGYSLFGSVTIAAEQARVRARRPYP